jgi:galactokinase
MQLSRTRSITKLLLVKKKSEFLILIFAFFRSAGAIGSRLTGAGWGGCIISLVPQNIVDSFFEYLRSHYYCKLENLPKNESEYMFCTQPAGGAYISFKKN